MMRNTIIAARPSSSTVAIPIWTWRFTRMMSNGWELSAPSTATISSTTLEHQLFGAYNETWPEKLHRLTLHPYLNPAF